MNGTTTLYRIFGAGHTLLYVGITDNYDQRMSSHAEKWWWREVRAIETEDFQSRAEAKAAESAAIRSEAPKHNRSENGAQPPRAPIPRANTTGKRRLVSLQDAASYFGVSTKTIRRYIARGDVAACRLPGSKLLRIDLADLDSSAAPVYTGAW